MTPGDVGIVKSQFLIDPLVQAGHPLGHPQRQDGVRRRIPVRPFRVGAEHPPHGRLLLRPDPLRLAHPEERSCQVVECPAAERHHRVERADPDTVQVITDPHVLDHRRSEPLGPSTGQADDPRVPDDERGRRLILWQQDGGPELPPERPEEVRGHEVAHQLNVDVRRPLSVTVNREPSVRIVIVHKHRESGRAGEQHCRGETIQVGQNPCRREGRGDDCGRANEDPFRHGGVLRSPSRAEPVGTRGGQIGRVINLDPHLVPDSHGELDTKRVGLLKFSVHGDYDGFGRGQ